MANLIKKFKSNFDDITEYYNFLVSKTKKHEYVDITNEWLIDNYYLLVEHKNNIENNKKEIKKDLKAIEKNYFFIVKIFHVIQLLSNILYNVVSVESPFQVRFF